MTNIFAIIILILVIGSAVFYVVNSKKKGAKCIGCPHADSCQRKSCK